MCATAAPPVFSAVDVKSPSQLGVRPEPTPARWGAQLERSSRVRQRPRWRKLDIPARSAAMSKAKNT